jgi:hypothetical protein
MGIKKKEASTIDGLFGSKTRVKLLHLFLNNPNKAFYVREITRLIDEQINSVRRELSNLLGAGVITSDTADNKLYYEINQNYEFYMPFRGIFAGEKVVASGDEAKVKPSSTVRSEKNDAWRSKVSSIKGVRIALAAGILVDGSASGIDLLVVGDAAPSKLKALVGSIESQEGRELNYSSMSYDEFYYRLSIRDRFINQIISSKHEVLVDVDSVLESQK